MDSNNGSWSLGGILFMGSWGCMNRMDREQQDKRGVTVVCGGTMTLAENFVGTYLSVTWVCLGACGQTGTWGCSNTQTCPSCLYSIVTATLLQRIKATITRLVMAQRSGTFYHCQQPTRSWTLSGGGFPQRENSLTSGASWIRSPQESKDKLGQTGSH
jgi:hypothetical protein